jgi:hypothetical protein
VRREGVGLGKALLERGEEEGTGDGGFITPALARWDGTDSIWAGTGPLSLSAVPVSASKVGRSGLPA